MANKDITGSAGDDVLLANQDHVQVLGNAGNDTITFHQFGGTAFGGAGDDVFNLSSPGTAQVHAYGALGKDTFYIDTSARNAPYGVHAWGGEGKDKFVFTNLNASDERMTGRLDDFNPVRDEIWLGDQKVDLRHPPDNVRLVEHQDQPWLLIDERVLYALEGARAVSNDGANTTEEVHFINWPTAWEQGVPASATMSYDDLLARFPVKQPEIDAMPRVSGSSQDDAILGTEKAELIIGFDGRDTLRGGGGDDVIRGDERNDLLYGGEGNDSLSGGLDQDTLYGGNGHDVLFGGAGHDMLYGEAGNDKLAGNAGRDLLRGGAGNDSLYGGEDDDILLGGAGSDNLFGRDGDDLLVAGGDGSKDAGVNRVDGGEGDDTLVGAEGQSTSMTGGKGADQFVGVQKGEILISDFDTKSDLLDLRGLIDQDADLSKLTHRVENGEHSDLRLDLRGDGSILLEGLGDLSPEALAEASLREGAAFDVDAEVKDLEAEIAGVPDLGGATADRGGNAAPPHGPKPTPQPSRGELPDEEGNGHEPDHMPPDDTRDTDHAAASHGGGGCFVATASFGGIDHPDVTWLRHFRDTILVHHKSGRTFIRFYWTVGPVLARYVRADRTSGRISRVLLSALVRGLKPLV